MAAQVDALHAAGCEKVYEETASGARNDRPVLADLMANIRTDDILIAYKLDTRINLAV